MLKLHILFNQNLNVPHLGGVKPESLYIHNFIYGLNEYGFGVESDVLYVSEFYFIDEVSHGSVDSDAVIVNHQLQIGGELGVIVFEFMFILFIIGHFERADGQLSLLV